MSRGKKYTKAEWDAIIALKGLGMSNKEIAHTIGRKIGGATIMQTINRYGGDYEKYADDYGRKKGKRSTEQLQFIPPAVFEPPKPKRIVKIPVKKIGGDEPAVDSKFLKWQAKKLQMATRQAVIIKDFVNELRKIGFDI